MSAVRPAVADERPHHGLRWMSAAALAAGVGLGLLQPLIVVAVGAGVYAGPTYLGLLFLVCVAAVLLVGLVAAFVRGGREITVPIVALGGCLALGMLGGNWLAATFHVSFAAPPPPPVIHPTGEGWTATGNLLVGRSHHTATLLLDGRVLVAGGDGSDERALSSAEIYDPRRGTWTATGSMVAPSAEHVATLLGDGRVLVTSYTGRAELYDPGTGTWSGTGSMRTPRISYAATLLLDGRVLVSGGRNPAIGAEQELASPELYDPATGTWKDAGGMRVLRASHTATLLSDGRVLVVGGQGSETSASNPMGFLASAEIYDPVKSTWTATTAMQTPRSGHAAALLADGKVWVAGSVVAPTAELYDPVTRTWKLGGRVEGWISPRASLLADGRVLVADGLGSIEIYDPRTSTSSRVANAEHGFGSSVTLLPDGKVLVAGGMLIHYGRGSDALTAVHLYEPE